MNENLVIEKIRPHTIKKFEIVEEYVKSWAQKLLNNSSCSNLVFIDCMSNCGQYYDENNNLIEGTALRVAKILKQCAQDYPNKSIDLYFNDIDPAKIDHLETLLPSNKNNFHVRVSKGDANDFLKELNKEFRNNRGSHYLLFYDPYEAAIDWDAITPFLNGWGEVIINHMVSDTLRAIKTAKSDKAVKKYEGTYLIDIEKLTSYKNKDDFEKRIEDIIKAVTMIKNMIYTFRLSHFLIKETDFFTF